MKKARVNAEDVARAAGVSTATVSLVVNGKAEKRVAADTRRRVLETIDRLGYTVDRRARGLATGQTGLVGLLVPDIVNPFFSLVHMALLREIGSHYQVLTVATDIGEKAARQNIEQLVATGVDALVAVSVDNAYLSSVRSAIPTVLVDTDQSGPGIAAVNFAIEDGARELANHLLALGHRSTVYVDGATPSRTFAARRNSFVDVIVSNGGRAPVAIETPVDMNHTASQLAGQIRAWLNGGATAIVCATDLQAYGALVALKKEGIRVPGEVSLASFDDLPFSTVVTPALTSVHVPGDKLAKAAAAELRGILSGQATSLASVVIGVELHARGSTGPAPSSRSNAREVPNTA